MELTTQAIPVGYKRTEIGAIPADWDVKKLGNVGEIKMCRRIFNNETKEIGAIPFYKIGTFGKTPDAYISQNLYDNYRHRFSFPKKGDILISAAGTIGRTIIYDGSPAYFQDSNIVWIDNNENLISNRYLYYVFQIVKYNTEGGTIQRLYNSILNNTKFICPTKIEQRAIATALSDVDTLIERLEMLLEKKKNIRLGTMQELLNGKRRLPGFNGEWKERRFGEIGKCYRGVSYSPDRDLSDSDTDSTLRLLRSNNVKEAKIVRSDLQFVDARRVSDVQRLRRDDILICMANGSKDLVGKAGRFLVDDGYSYTFGAFMGCFRPNAQMVRPDYIFYIFQTEKYRNHISLLLAGSSINNLRPSDLEIFSSPFPLDPTEQAAVADFLSDMDNEIQQLESQLTKYQNLKLGMTQVLLTGKIRLV